MPIHPLVRGMPYDVAEMYRDTFCNAWTDAVQTEGPQTFVGTNESAALHEAGHIIVVASQGYRPTWARIWQEDSWVGYTDADGPWLKVGPGATSTVNVQCAHNVMAGFIAERVLEGDAAKLGSSLDERVAALMLGTWAACGAGRKADAMAFYGEIEASVTEIIASSEAVAREIARALIEVAPNKLEGQVLADMVVRIPCPAPRPPGRAEARRLRQIAKRGKAA
jgi:hypothetical protein